MPRLSRFALLFLAGCLVLFMSGARADKLVTAATESLIIFSEISVSVDMHASLPRSATRDPQLLKQLRDEVNVLFRDIREQADGDYEEFGDDGFNPYSVILNWTEQFVSDRYLSLLEVTYYYTGGAHGNTGFTSLLWDLSTHQEVELTEIINNTEDGSAALKAIARHLREALVEEKMERNGFSEEEAREDDGWDQIKASLDSMETFVFVPSWEAGQIAGLTFVYGPYQLGSYAEGDYRLFVPAFVFAEFLNPEFKALFGGEPVIMEPLSSYPLPGATILLEEPRVTSGITSPLELKGEAPDFWFEYGEALVEVYANDEKIGEARIEAVPEATLSGAAAGMVRFTGEIIFDTQPPDSYGELRFLRGSGEHSSPPNKITWWFTYGN